MGSSRCSRRASSGFDLFHAAGETLAHKCGERCWLPRAPRKSPCDRLEFSCLHAWCSYAFGAHVAVLGVHKALLLELCCHRQCVGTVSPSVYVNCFFAESVLICVVLFLVSIMSCKRHVSSFRY